MKYLNYLYYISIGLFGYLAVDAIVQKDYNFALIWGGLLIMDIGFLLSSLRDKK